MNDALKIETQRSMLNPRIDTDERPVEISLKKKTSEQIRLKLD